MVNFLLFCMAVVGLTCIILESSIFAPIRNILSHILPTKIYEVFECHQCMGFWAGCLIGYFLLADSLIMVLIYGFAGSFLAKFYEIIHSCLDVWYMNNMHTEIEVKDE